MVAAREYRLHTLAWPEVDEADVWYLSRDYDTSVEFLSDLDAALEAISHAPQRWPKVLARHAAVCHAALSLLRCLPGWPRIHRYRCGCAQQAEAGLLERAALTLFREHFPTMNRYAKKLP